MRWALAEEALDEDKTASGGTTVGLEAPHLPRADGRPGDGAPGAVSVTTEPAR